VRENIFCAATQVQQNWILTRPAVFTEEATANSITNLNNILQIPSICDVDVTLAVILTGITPPDTYRFRSPNASPHFLLGRRRSVLPPIMCYADSDAKVKLVFRDATDILEVQQCEWFAIWNVDWPTHTGPRAWLAAMFRRSPMIMYSNRNISRRRATGAL